MKLKLLFIALFWGIISWGQSFSGTYPFTSVTTSSGSNDPTAVPTATGVTFGPFSSVGLSTNPNAGGRFSFTGNDTGATNGSDVFTGSLNIAKYYQVTITPQAGFTLDINSITFTLQRSGTGIRQYAVRSSLDYTTNLPASIATANANLSVVSNNIFQVVDSSTSANLGSTITLGSAYDVISSAITFRFYAWNAEAAGGTFSIDDVVINGVASPACTPPSIPNGSISGTSPACGSTLLIYSGTATAPIMNYWQTSVNGTSTINNATTPLNVSTSGNYYVRAFDPNSGATGCWSSALGPYAVTINNIPSFTTNPVNSIISETNSTNFSVVATGAGLTYQWQVNTGSGFVNLSNSAPYSNVTTATMTVSSVTLAMNGYQYQCIVSGALPCASITSSVATLYVTNSNPNNPLNAVACYGNNSVLVSWTASIPTAVGSITPDGYMVFASQGATAPTSTQQFDASSYSANSNFSLATTATPATLGKCVYIGSATTATITGLLNNTNYSFTILAYKGNTQTGWSYGINSSGSWNITNVTINVPNVSALAASIENAQSTITWNRPTPLSCYDEYLVVANQGAVTFTPSGDGSLYSANSTYSSPNQVVYKGTGSNFIVSGLTNYLNYCFKVFVRRGTEWSSGVSICQTPILIYCPSSGTTVFQTSITNVSINTINNTTAKPSGYSDYTASQSTNLQKGATYPLSVKLNTDGNNTVLAYAWIDFNQDGDFFDFGEAYDLGSATNTTNGLTNVSPINIIIPSTATLGTTRMRVMVTYNNDTSACATGFDGEVEDYSIVITAGCSPTAAITSFVPTSGPAGTEVTISGSGFTSSTLVEFNSNAATVIFVNSSTIIATVPSGVTNGLVSVTEGNCTANSTTNFNQLSSSGNCSSANNLNGLIISEIYSSLTGKSFYAELYNPTSETIDLDAIGADYKLIRYGDIGQTNGIHTIELSGTIPPGGIYLADLGIDSICGSLGFNYSNKNYTLNENDEIRLTKNGVLQDLVYCPNELGYSITRNVSAVGPSAIYNTTDWTIQSSESCLNLDNVPFTYVSNMPSINLNPVDNSVCGTTANFTVGASASSGILTYQWYFNDSVSSTWAPVISSSFSGVSISGETTPTLNLTGNLNLFSNYQFYCKLLLNGTCTAYSNAAQIKVISTTWNGIAWSNGTPNASTQAIFSGNYSSNSDLYACSLMVNSGTVQVNSNHNFVVTNEVIVSGGSLIFENNSSLIQINNAVNTGNITYKRNTTPMKKYDYTYWSSPVNSQSLLGLSPLTLSDKYFQFDPAIGYWSPVTSNSIMSLGKGYIVRAPQNFDPVNATIYNASFIGVPNNGIITTPIQVSTSDYNLIGNPYPSAISADLFLSASANTSAVDGTIYLWTHNTPVTNLQYSSNDYAVYNLLGGVGTAAVNQGINNSTPNGTIASGQSFFIKGLTNNATATFLNSMRLVANNSQFFKTPSISNPTNFESQKHRFWLGITDTSGSFKQTLIGYTNEATLGFDRGYDGYLMNPTSVCIYSLSENNALSIQGLPLPFSVSDEVPIGIHLESSGNYKIGLTNFDGLFNSQDIFLKDKQENSIHNLKQGDYSFSSLQGTFNNRFEILFQNNLSNVSAPSINANSVVIYKPNQELFIDAGSILISKVKVMDARGSVLLEKEVHNTSKTSLQLSAINQLLFIEITSISGDSITKKYVN
jgi:hypothetical protein